VQFLVDLKKPMENIMLNKKLPALLSLALVTFVLSGCGAKEESKMDATKQSIQDAAETVKAKTTEAADATAGMADKAKADVHAMADDTADAATEAVDKAGAMADDAADSVKDAADDAADSVKDAADDAADEAKKAQEKLSFGPGN
jgi:PBP1b-binding outer membrane lipoprotein LpoB